MFLERFNSKSSYINVLKIFVLLLIGAIVSLIIGEVGARLLRLSHTYNSYPWHVNAGSVAEYTPELNSQGWRDREFRKDKDSGIFRIACIGDSVTEGYNADFKDIFPKVLERGLKDKGYSVEVMNLGLSGNATFDNLKAIKSVMEFDPDFIIYQFGMNDIEGFEHAEFASEGNANDHNVDSDRAKAKSGIKVLLRKSVLYLAIAERYNYLKLKAGYKNWAFDEWKISDEEWEGEFVKLKSAFDAIKHRTRLLVIYIPYDFQVYSSRQEVYIPDKKLGSFCERNGYDYLDFTYIFKECRNRYRLFIDDCHLSAYGHGVVAECLEEEVLRRVLSGEFVLQTKKFEN
ncbi:SGNH/GDSL hydrolase family protein [Candidatus Omnitrophota bacterium]